MCNVPRWSYCDHRGVPASFFRVKFGVKFGVKLGVTLSATFSATFGATFGDPSALQPLQYRLPLLHITFDPRTRHVP